ncbi:MAG: ATP-binding protein [Gammaproteobacteria bacterium]
MALRSRLFHKLFAAIALASLASVVSFALGAQWYMQRSFVRYLNDERSARLEELAEELGLRYAEEGSWTSLSENPRAWRRLLFINAGVKRDTDELGTAAADDGDDATTGRRPRSRAMLRDPLGRFTLYDAEREIVAGRIPFDAALQTRAIEVGGRTVGWLAIRPLSSPAGPRERRYARRQLYMMLIGSAVAAVLSLLCAWWLARRLVRPVRAIGSAAHELAAGRFDTRLPGLGGDEIGQLADDFNVLARTLAENETARRRWVADISHELRTPLAILHGEIEAVQDGIRPLDERLLQSLACETQRMQQLIDDLYQLARADIGAMEYTFERVALAPLAAATLQRFAHRFDEAGLALTQTLDAELTVMADRARLTQLLENLCENCCRYVNSPGQIAISLQRRGGDAVLVVADSGPGVAPEELERLFEPLHRTEGSRSRRFGGAGLGLALCQRIAHAHGGRITATQSALGGLALTLTIPLTEAP